MFYDLRLDPSVCIKCLAMFSCAQVWILCDKNLTFTWKKRNS